MVVRASGRGGKWCGVDAYEGMLVAARGSWGLMVFLAQVQLGVTGFCIGANGTVSFGSWRCTFGSVGARRLWRGESSRGFYKHGLSGASNATSLLFGGRTQLMKL